MTAEREHPHPRALPADFTPESLLSAKARQALPTLAKIRAEVLESQALGRKRHTRVRPRPPRPPWVAVPISDDARFKKVLRGVVYAITVCECADCVAVLAQALRPRTLAGRGKAHLILISTGAVARALIARGLSVQANNLRISRAWLLAKEVGTVIPAGGMQRALAGHLVQVEAKTMTKAAAYLVSRLPAPTT